MEFEDLLSLEDVAQILNVRPSSIHNALHKMGHDGRTAQYRGFTFHKVGKAGGRGSWVAVQNPKGASEA